MARRAGKLFPRKRFPAGKTNITVRVEKIQLKDPGQYFDPFVTVNLVGAARAFLLPLLARWWLTRPLSS